MNPLRLYEEQHAHDVRPLVAYACFYLWFEAFPYVFTGIYHFKGGVADLPFNGILVGAIVAYIALVIYTLYYFQPRLDRLNAIPGGPGAQPEEQLRLGLISGAFIPISLLVFGWTSRESVHWIWPIFGAALYMPGEHNSYCQRRSNFQVD